MTCAPAKKAATTKGWAVAIYSARQHGSSRTRLSLIRKATDPWHRPHARYVSDASCQIQIWSARICNTRKWRLALSGLGQKFPTFRSTLHGAFGDADSPELKTGARCYPGVKSCWQRFVTADEPRQATPYSPRDLPAALAFLNVVVITSNQSLGAWGEVFGDPIIASAILDRLLHRSITINIKGESFRLKEKRRAGLLDKSAPAEPGRIPAPEKL